MTAERRQPLRTEPRAGALDAKFLLYLAFVASWFLHLSSRIFILGKVRFDLLLVAAITLLVFAHVRQPDPQEDNRIGRWLSILIGFALLTIPFVEWPGSVLRFGLRDFVKAAVFYFFTVQTIDSVRKLRILIGVFLAAQSFRILEPLYLHLTEGYWGSAAFIGGGEFMDRLSGAPHDVVNPNGLAHVILTTLPFFHFLAPTSFRQRVAYLALLPVFLYALALTGSRSGLLGLFALVFIIFLRSRHKVLIATAVAVGVLVAVPQLDADQRDRFLSIFRKDTRNARTAAGRLHGIVQQFETASHRPIVGHGLGTSKEANFNVREDARVAHILYGEVATELGYVGLAIYLGFLYSIMRTVRNQQALARGKPGNEYVDALTQGIGAWFFMNVLFSFATYGLSEPSWYLFAGLTVVVGRLYKSSVDEAVPRPVPLRAHQISPRATSG